MKMDNDGEYKKSKGMNRESIVELQKIDCNCNDCKFMVRDFGNENFKFITNENRKRKLG